VKVFLADQLLAQLGFLAGASQWIQQWRHELKSPGSLKQQLLLAVPWVP